MLQQNNFLAKCIKIPGAAIEESVIVCKMIPCSKVMLLIRTYKTARLCQRIAFVGKQIRFEKIPGHDGYGERTRGKAEVLRQIARIAASEIS